MTTSKNLIFFGSGPVAAETLAGLLQAGLHFETIITKPRAAGHRGSVPVLELAHEHDLAVHTPTSKKELSELFAAHHFSAQVGLVVDYGIIIAQDVIDAFPSGIINSHFSLLPQWRGADPITFALLSGQAETGVSLMLINDKLDEGLLLAQQTMPVAPTVTIHQLTNQLVQLSNRLILHQLPRYLAGEITPYTQTVDQPPTYSRKLTKQDGVIDWAKPAMQLEREIRAFLGWPKSQAIIFGHKTVLLKARVAMSLDDGILVLPCGQKTYLEVQELISPSGKRMDGAAFIRGYHK